MRRIKSIKTTFLINDENPRMFNITVVKMAKMIDGYSEAMAFLEIGSLSEGQGQGYGIKKGRESRFVERIGLSTARSAISSPESTICSCQARRPSRIQDFRDSPGRVAHRSRHALVCTHLRIHITTSRTYRAFVYFFCSAP